MPKERRKSAREVHDPLHLQMERDRVVVDTAAAAASNDSDGEAAAASSAASAARARTRERVKKSGGTSSAGSSSSSRKTGDDGLDDDSMAISKKQRERILSEARKQREELMAEEDEDDGDAARASSRKQRGAAAAASAYAEYSESESEMDDEDEEHYLDDVEEIDEADERVLQAFLKPRVAGPSLSDVIMAKIREHERAAKLPSASTSTMTPLNPKVLDAYQGVGKILASYRSGRLPKAFKIVPSLRNWEDILALTSPSSWSDQAMHAATRVFMANLHTNMAQRYVNLVLLPRIREQIEQTHKLSFHLYMALKRSVFKPGAFYKGIVLPLCESGSCSLREALVVSSIIKKMSIPYQHSGAVLLRLADMEYTPANSLFMRVLLNKKYDLPYRVIDTIVTHFMRFVSERRALPVMWHQCLLIFVQRYKNDLTEEQQDAIRSLLHHQRHRDITPEIHRELQHATPRGAEQQNIIAQAQLVTGSGTVLDAMAL